MAGNTEEQSRRTTGALFTLLFACSSSLSVRAHGKLHTMAYKIKLNSDGSPQSASLLLKLNKKLLVKYTLFFCSTAT
jgi:hypothetical protein